MPPKRKQKEKLRLQQLMFGQVKHDCDYAMNQHNNEKLIKMRFAKKFTGVELPERVFAFKSEENKLYSMVNDFSVTLADIADVITAEPELAFKADSLGATAMHMAAFYGRIDVVDCLLKNGGAASLTALALPKPPEVSAGVTPLWAAVLSDRTAVVELIADYVSGHGDVEPNALAPLIFKNGQTPLHVASAFNPEMAKILLTMGFPVDSPMKHAGRDIMPMSIAMTFRDDSLITAYYEAGSRFGVEDIKPILETNLHNGAQTLSLLQKVTPQFLFNTPTLAAERYHEMLSTIHDDTIKGKEQYAFLVFDVMSRLDSPVVDALFAILQGNIDKLRALFVTHEGLAALAKEQALDLVVAGVSSGSLKVVQYLHEEAGLPLPLGADHGSTVVTPLLWTAAVYNYQDMVRYLLDKGAFPNPQVAYQKASGMDKPAEVHFKPMSEMLIQQCEPETARLVFERFANINEVDGDSRGLLHAALEAKRPEMLSMLLSLGLKLEGDHLACNAFQLLEDVEEGPARSEFYRVILLHSSVQAESTATMTQQVPYNGVTEKVTRPIPGKVSTLDRSVTSLHLACLSNDIDLYKMLTADIFSNVMVRTRTGETPLHYAVRGKSHHIISEMLTADTCELDTVDNDGHSPLHLALYHKDIVAADMLLSAESHRFRIDVDQMTGIGTGKTLLTVCVEDKQLHALVPCLLALGANPNVPDRNGETPLIHAIIKRYIPLVRQLLEHGADVKTMNPATAMSPLDYFRLIFPRLDGESVDIAELRSLIEDRHSAPAVAGGASRLPLRVEVANLREKLTLAERQVGALRGVAQKLQERLRSAEAAVPVATDAEEVEALRRDNEMLKQQRGLFEKQAKMFQQQLTASKEEQLKIVSNPRSLEAIVEECIADTEKAKREKDAVAQQLQVIKEELTKYDDLDEKLQASLAANASISERFKGLADESEGIKAKIRELNAVNKALRAENETLRSAPAFQAILAREKPDHQVRKALGELKGQLADVRSVIAAPRNDKMLHSTVAQIKDMIQAVQAELAATKSRTKPVNHSRQLKAIEQTLIELRERPVPAMPDHRAELRDIHLAVQKVLDRPTPDLSVPVKQVDALFKGMATLPAAFNELNKQISLRQHNLAQRISRIPDIVKLNTPPSADARAIASLSTAVGEVRGALRDMRDDFTANKKATTALVTYLQEHHIEREPSPAGASASSMSVGSPPTVPTGTVFYSHPPAPGYSPALYAAGYGGYPAPPAPPMPPRG